MRVCTTPGCPTLVPTGTGQCQACTQARHRRTNQRRPTTTQRGYGRAWFRTRGHQLKHHPTCAHCGQPAAHVHHIDGHGPNGPRGHDPTNLLSLCLSCHSRVTARDQPGGWHATRPTRGP